MKDVLYSAADLRKFDRLTQKLSSPDGLTRIMARLAVKKFVEEHGQEKCDAMFVVLRARDEKRGKAA